MANIARVTRIGATVYVAYTDGHTVTDNHEDESVAKAVMHRVERAMGGTLSSLPLRGGKS